MRFPNVRPFLAGLSIRDYITVSLVVGLTLLLGVARCQRDQARDEARDNAFRADSIAAFSDSTRSMNAKAQKLLADSLIGVERRAWQAEIQRDALDKALGRTTHALTNMSLAFKDLRAQGVTTRVVESGDLRTATFKVDSTPYHATATVALPPAPAVGAFTLKVKLDPARVGVRIQCGKPSATGIRPATAAVTTPPWLDAELERPQFDPDVCNSEKHKGFPWKSVAGGLLAGGILGAVIR